MVAPPPPSAGANGAPADVPEKYRRAVELARRDQTGVRWEYFFNPLPRSATKWLESCLCDARDLPMVLLISNICTTVVLAAAAQYLLLEPGSKWGHVVGAVYLVATTALFDARFILCLHYAQHLKLFNPAAIGRLPAALLNEVLPTVLAPLFGIPSGMYFLHHVAMHHVEDNLFPHDLSSTMPYQRDSFLDFLKYWATYVSGTAVYLPLYALSKGRPRLAAYSALLLGSWGALVCGARALHPTAALWTLVIPVLKSSLTLMFGNFSQHIFVDPAAPECDYTSTYNCMAVLDNRFTFNDGYHIVHHLNARKHWSEMPQAFVDNLPKYEAHEALLFENLFFFDIGILVMTGQWSKLARHVVQLSDTPKSEAEIIRLLKRRVQRIPWAPTPDGKPKKALA